MSGTTCYETVEEAGELLEDLAVFRRYIAETRNGLRLARSRGAMSTNRGAMADFLLDAVLRAAESLVTFDDHEALLAATELSRHANDFVDEMRRLAPPAPSKDDRPFVI